MSGEERKVPEDVCVSVVENLKIDLQNAQNERDQARTQRDEAIARLEAEERATEECVRQRDLAQDERNEARAEIERLTEALYEAGMQAGLLEREVARLRRGIEAYRMAHECDDLDSEWPAVEGCASCAWERGEGKVREESGDER